MSKKVAFSTKPAVEKPTIDADQWVQHRNTEGTKRLTIDIPSSLHTTIKVSCAQRGTKIADEVRELLEQRYKDANTRN